MTTAPSAVLAFSALHPALPCRSAIWSLPATKARPARTTTRPRVARMALDPGTLSHAVHSAHAALADAFPGASSLPPMDALHAVSLALSDAAAAVSATADTAVSAAADVAATAGDAAVDTAATASRAGLWKSFVDLVESAIVAIRSTLHGAGIPGAYGLSIILFTLSVKALTYPLNFRQMESTLKMQALAPRLRKLQADYKDNPAVLNQMTADLYRDQNVNPLAGCLPVFAQIPVWIALYRSVLNLAADNQLDEPFLWLPSLQGPVSRTGQGLSTWLFPLVDGHPPIGWHDAVCYMILPVVLMATQFYSQKIMSPPSSDPQSQQANKFLKFMPLLIGWFSLNVPSGLGVYWVTNNVLSTVQTLYIRSKFPELASQAAASPPADEDDNGVAAPRLEPVDGFTRGGSAKVSKAGKSKKRRKRR